MHEFSTADGFLEITESLAEMIKYVANEPSVGLFYIQQHAQNAIPNLINTKNNVVEKAQEMTLHTEDLEDSITVVRSMKECGYPIADEMIQDITKSLAIMSTKHPKKGLLSTSSFGFQMGRTSSWGGPDSAYTQQYGERTGNYLSSVLKSAKERASNFKWPQFDNKQSTRNKGERPVSFPTPPFPVAAASTSSTLLDAGRDELPISSETLDESQEEFAVEGSCLSDHELLSVSENYEEFRADKEAKLEKWLGGANGQSSALGGRGTTDAGRP
ncbi:uncharacterized protein LOC127806276 [Diospyros lotus]|uniref:uncharacterized protein LOC127806276 n=1 Tax=Diospyros lotus TaxID=55363 RepID=UPI0022529823|nr:uncharacterized protein LOC127806276 [Diospyros lotus]XP_052199428.1 uncharacterized protein LOC127806276 [Diospyros lotus]XP_052199429.1 uncharacterized protein LOC127806276 [Diospyros lotus]XP_052199430.1 uncharacterized protein LOC127806276 [Diospyros lotus]